jgi:hypothetical protein
VDKLPVPRRILWTVSFCLEASSMHLCGTLDIVLALLFASQTSAFSELLGRQFDPRRWCHLRTTELAPVVWTAPRWI